MAQRSHPQLREAAWLRERYEQQHGTLVEIARELGVSVTAIVRAMRKHGIVARTPEASRLLRGTPKQRRQFPALEDAVWLRGQYEQQGRSLEEIAADVGCSHVVVLKALRRHGVARRTPGQLRAGRTRQDAILPLRDAEWLREQYLTLRRSPSEIAVELDCSALTVTTALSGLAIHRRPRIKPGERRAQKTSGGYRVIWLPTHPAATSKGMVPEHRIVAEESLGRYLLKAEVVHHLNERPDDNWLENLMVFPSNGAHMRFHANPPAWMPRCSCCGHTLPEQLTGRPEGVPLLWAGEEAAP